MKKVKEEIKVSPEKKYDNELGFVDIKESEDMQKRGYKVIEIKVIDGIKKHRLEKNN